MIELIKHEDTYCKVSEWSAWSKPEISDDKFVRKRSRKIIRPSLNQCPNLLEIELVDRSEKFKKVDQVILKNQFLSLNVKSEIECKARCLELNACAALFFSTDRRDPNDNCLLFSNESYVAYKDLTRSAWQRMDLTLPVGHLSVSMRLLGNATIHSADSEHECWSKCIRSAWCVAISFQQKQCRLFVKGSFISFNESNWISVARSSENLLNFQVKSIVHDSFIVDSNRTNAMNEVECWRKCLSNLKCTGISFSTSDFACHSKYDALPTLQARSNSTSFLKA